MSQPKVVHSHVRAGQVRAGAGCVLGLLGVLALAPCRDQQRDKHRREGAPAAGRGNRTLGCAKLVLVEVLYVIAQPLHLSQQLL